MDIETIQEISSAIPAVTEDIKWDNNLVFSVGGKMFCIIATSELPVNASFKVTEEEFEELCEREGFQPAPYLARYKWVMIDDISRLRKIEWEKYLQQSYNLVKSKLPAKVLKELGIP